MKALSVRQPWAWAIMEGHKPIENRTWRTTHRGPIAIVASRSRDSLESGLAFLRHLDIEPPEEFVFGAILGTVELVDIHPITLVRNPFAEGPFCWLFERQRKLARPIPFAGRLCLFEVPSELLKTENP